MHIILSCQDNGEEDRQTRSWSKEGQSALDGQGEMEAQESQATCQGTLSFHSDINASYLLVEIKNRRFDQVVRRKRIYFLEKILLNIYVSFSILTLFWRNSQLG